MFFKVVNKCTGNIDGWGKSKTLEDFCERYDMSQVDVEEISEYDFKYLQERLNIHDELISFFANEKTKFSEEDICIASSYQHEWDNLPCDTEGANDDQDKAMEELLNRATDEIYVSRESEEEKESRLKFGNFTESEKALLESEVNEGKKILERERGAEPIFNIGLTRGELLQIKLFLMTEIENLKTDCIKWHERNREKDSSLAPNEWVDMRRYTIKNLAKLRNISEKLDNVYKDEEDF